MRLSLHRRCPLSLSMLEAEECHHRSQDHRGCVRGHSMVPLESRAVQWRMDTLLLMLVDVARLTAEAVLEWRQRGQTEDQRAPHQRMTINCKRCSGCWVRPGDTSSWVQLSRPALAQRRVSEAPAQPLVVAELLVLSCKALHCNSRAAMMIDTVHPHQSAPTWWRLVERKSR